MRARACAHLHALLSCAHAATAAAAERNEGRKDGSARNGPVEVTALIKVQGESEPRGLAAVAAAALLSITSCKQQQQRKKNTEFDPIRLFSCTNSFFHSNYKRDALN